MSNAEFPISKKQHDLIAGLITEQSAASRRLEIACNAVLGGIENEPSGMLKGVRSENGSHWIVLNVKDETQ